MLKVLDHIPGNLLSGSLQTCTKIRGDVKIQVAATATVLQPFAKGCNITLSI